MKRLIKKADAFYEPENKVNIEEKLQAAANFFCRGEGMDPSTIVLEGGANASVTFGNIEEYGYEISVDTYHEGEINRIMITMGKNPNVYKTYIETREQEMLDAFLSQSTSFSSWIDSSLEILESKDNWKGKSKK